MAAQQRVKHLHVEELHHLEHLVSAGAAGLPGQAKAPLQEQRLIHCLTAAGAAWERAAGWLRAQRWERSDRLSRHGREAWNRSMLHRKTECTRSPTAMLQLEQNKNSK